MTVINRRGGTQQIPASRFRLALSLPALAVLTVLCASTPATFGAFTAKVSDSTDTAATNPYFTCAATDAYSGNKSPAYFEYPLTDPSNSTAATDASGHGATGTYQGTMTAVTPSPVACPRDPGSAYSLNGTSSYLTTPTQYTNPTTFTLVAWFKTTTAGGRIIGWGSSRTGASTQYDRHVYIASSGPPIGHLVFGINSTAKQILTSPSSVTDGQWHMVAASLSPAGGMTLYLDGVAAASNTSYTTPDNNSGYWRIGYDQLTGWPNAPTTTYFTGTLRYAAAYSAALTAAEVAAEYAAGR